MSARVNPLRACPCCGSEHLAVAVPEDRLGCSYHVDRCTGCGVAFTNPQPVDEDLVVRYVHADSYDPQVCPRSVRGLLALDAVKSLDPDVRHRRGTLLDVGCGEGSFLDAMRALGWTGTGVEVNRRGLGAARGKGLNIVGKDFYQAALPSAGFDLITLWHVLEHLRDPLRALRRCFELLRPGGVLVVATPNIESYQAQRFGPRWHSLNVPDHLFHFSPRALTAVCLHAGFDSVEIKPAMTRQAEFAFTASCASDLIAAKRERRWGRYVMTHVLYRCRPVFLAFERFRNRSGSIGAFARRPPAFS